MCGLGGANEPVIGNVQLVAHRHEIGRHFIAQTLHIAVLPSCSLDHFQAVFVGAGGEAHVATLHPLKPRNRVRCNRFIGMADVRPAVGIADRGGDVERVGGGNRFSHAVRL